MNERAVLDREGLKFVILLHQFGLAINFNERQIQEVKNVSAKRHEVRPVQRNDWNCFHFNAMYHALCL